MIKVAILITVVIVLGILYYLFPIIEVVGDSMYPTYKDGEIIFGTRLYRKSKLRKRDVIIYTSPREERIVIKRIDDIRKKNNRLYFYCLGDNRDYSYDSREYGYVSSKRLKCKVLNQRRKKRCMQ